MLKNLTSSFIFRVLTDLKEQKAADLAAGLPPLEAEANRIAALKRRLRMDSLKDLAVDWTERACNRLEEIGDDGKNIIQRGWNDIYLDKALDPDFIVAARFRKAERAAKQAAELKEKEEAAQAAVLITAVGMPPGEIVAAMTEARNAVAAAAREAANNPLGWDDVQVVARAEAAFHEGQIPKKRTLRSSAKPRPGKGKSLKRKLGTGSAVERMVAERVTKARRKGPSNVSRAPMVKEMKAFLKSKDVEVVGRGRLIDLKSKIELSGWWADLQSFVAEYRKGREGDLTEDQQAAQQEDDVEEEEVEEEEREGVEAEEVNLQSEESESDDDDSEDVDYESEVEVW
ncbi:hypothetical protein BCR33DRAFT_725458 [Rhizoclosmatium globosum]|uniref:Uncharacterized protein n=1 Tax=Rhizoclosmatium globosum TaxID=329046 RepID=A0A1Y2AYE3_9FUNG|nr:hypothetical protein BCR33DRAFT_729331 [Rhizoclosmatium globosum]ORY27582.1 hypothetical protein BCR33DRAFT_725458 [Rhizoclosmatium globosum]|eukprot:ORY21509.1 hypothetical protein BCR33DRAFT_729331 [Rhizoclosmatium globosum]